MLLLIILIPMCTDEYYFLSYKICIPFCGGVSIFSYINERKRNNFTREMIMSPIIQFSHSVKIPLRFVNATAYS